MHLFHAVGLLALMSITAAQNATQCSGEVCYAVNVPAITASSGVGDIFFQISGPSSMSWIGLGQGSSMKGSNIFMIYANSAGTNVTLSSRLGIGNQEPYYSAANVTLLAGSGISNDVMTANVRCSSCNSWSGGSMSLTDSDSKWIWAYHSGGTVSSDSVNVTVPPHTAMGTATFNLQNAAGGSSANPFNTSSSAASSGAGSNNPLPPNYTAVQMAHGIMAPIAFALFFPFGAIATRTLSFPGLVWFHSGWMAFTYIIVLASMGLGVWMAVVSQQLDTFHAIIGLVVVGCLIIQPVTGLTHHLLYKRVGRTNAATYPHVWWGRMIITLGIINGGLGLQLSGNTTNGEIAYGVVAGFMWLLWMTVITLAYFKTQNASKGETGTYIMRRAKQSDSDGSMSRTQPSQPRSTAGSSPSASWVEEGQARG